MDNKNDKFKSTAKRYMETDIIAKLAVDLNISENEAMDKFYHSLMYTWFLDDEQYGIAREGVDAMVARVINELNGGKPY